MDVRVGLWRKLSTEELMLLNCGVGEDSIYLESPLDCKEIQPVHSKGDQSWGSLEGLMLKLKLQNFGHLMWRVDSLERLWGWETLGQGGEGEDRGWDGWMSSPSQWTWVWANSRRWWWIGRPGMLGFIRKSGTQLSDQTELNWTVILSTAPWVVTIWKRLAVGIGFKDYNLLGNSFYEHLYRYVV